MNSEAVLFGCICGRCVKSKNLDTICVSNQRSSVRYVAKITFQKRTFTLGTFGRMDEAIAARQKAERVLFDFVVDYYERYRQHAAADAHWAEDNPPRVLVTQDENKELSVTVWPELSAIEP